jgi:hypothetical protein
MISRREFRRRNYPYGRWTCEDGREVLFNWHYRPIWQRRPGAAAEPADPTEQVPWKSEDWFYADRHREPEKLARGKAALAEWRLPSPK